MRSAFMTGVVVAALAAPSAFAQVTPEVAAELDQAYEVDSGERFNPAPAPAVVWRHLVQVADAKWLRVHLGADTWLAPGSVVRMTSLDDLEVQQLDNQGLDVWSLSSAYFNGSMVLVELVAAPGVEASRVVVERVSLSFGGPARASGGCGVCDEDTREPSDFPWAARLMPAQCSSTMYNDSGCFVTAGHCVDGTNNDLVQFNVPPSDSDCSINHPPIADQFPISAKLFSNAGVGADWGVLLSGVNSDGETAFERYGVFLPMAQNAPLVGDATQVTGYGIDGECTETRVQQTDTQPGEVVTVGTTFIRYRTDAVSGNSGSSVRRDDEIIGVATHCPCPNVATRWDAPGFLVDRTELCGSKVPENDDCEDAQPVAEGSFPFTTMRTTTDGPSLPKECDEGNGRRVRKDIWYLYTASCDGIATVSTCDADFDTRLAVYTPDVCPGEFIACNDDACGPEGIQSQVTFPVEQGATYRIRVGSFRFEGTGTLEIACGQAGPCPGDLDSSGDVSFNDLLLVLSAWGPYEPCPPFIPADLDESCEVGFADVVTLLSLWGACP